MDTSQKPPSRAEIITRKAALEARAESKLKPSDNGPHKRIKGSRIVSDPNDDFHKIYMYAPQERIDAIKRGVPAEAIARLSGKMNIPKEWLIGTLGLSRATLSRKERASTSLSKDESERVLGVQALIGQVEAMIRESGNPIDFDAAKWVSGWLNSPIPALGGNKPASYMDTIEGQKLVANLLAMTQSGAYA
jgi:putative toxin-antitoxin system antitoxin component (TIGR02293 family)